MSICGLEDVAREAGEGFWFQLYVMRDRAFARQLIARAQAVNCPVLVLTLDLSLVGQRHKDIRNGLTDPSRLTLRQLMQIARRPRWALGQARSPYKGFGNVLGHAQGIKTMADMARWKGGELDPSLDWADVAEIRRLWKGRLVLKGIQDAEDARLAVLPDRALVMHPGPMNRGLEISSAAADSERSTVLEQVANGVGQQRGHIDRVRGVRDRIAGHDTTGARGNEFVDAHAVEQTVHRNAYGTSEPRFH